MNANVGVRKATPGAWPSTIEPTVTRLAPMLPAVSGLDDADRATALRAALGGRIGYVDRPIGCDGDVSALVVRRAIWPPRRDSFGLAKSRTAVR